MKKLKKALVVDDSKLARLTLSRLLRERGLEVLEAASVSEGMDVLNATDKVDAIFMDVMMPEKDGFEGLDIIKRNAKFKHIPCSMYSGDLSIEAQKKAIASGAQAYLFKPASGDGIDHVLKALEANVIAENMRQFTDSKEKPNELNKNVSQLLATLDNRTKNLARVLTKERKEKENTYHFFEERINSILENVNDSKELSNSFEREEIDRKRVESELRAQIERMRGNVKKMTVFSIIAIIIAITAIVLYFINQFL